MKNARSGPGFLLAVMKTPESEESSSAALFFPLSVSLFFEIKLLWKHLDVLEIVPCKMNSNGMLISESRVYRIHGRHSTPDSGRDRFVSEIRHS